MATQSKGDTDHTDLTNLTDSLLGAEGSTRLRASRGGSNQLNDYGRQGVAVVRGVRIPEGTDP